jgi:hypothetical protein
MSALVKTLSNLLFLTEIFASISLENVSNLASNPFLSRAFIQPAALSKVGKSRFSVARALSTWCLHCRYYLLSIPRLMFATSFDVCLAIILYCPSVAHFSVLYRKNCLQ